MCVVFLKGLYLKWNQDENKSEAMKIHFNLVIGIVENARWPYLSGTTLSGTSSVQYCNFALIDGTFSTACAAFMSKRFK